MSLADGIRADVRGELVWCWRGSDLVGIWRRLPDGSLADIRLGCSSVPESRNVALAAVKSLEWS